MVESIGCARQIEEIAYLLCSFCCKELIQNTLWRISMLSIRPANLNDVSELKALIHEMGEYERMPVVVTKESLARDGFGPRPEFRVLIAEWDGQPAGYAFFFSCYSTFRGRGLFLEA